MYNLKLLQNILYYIVIILYYSILCLRNFTTFGSFDVEISNQRKTNINRETTKFQAVIMFEHFC